MFDVTAKIDIHKTWDGRPNNIPMDMIKQGIANQLAQQIYKALGDKIEINEYHDTDSSIYTVQITIDDGRKDNGNSCEIKGCSWGTGGHHL